MSFVVQSCAYQSLCIGFLSMQQHARTCRNLAQLNTANRFGCFILTMNVHATINFIILYHDRKSSNPSFHVSKFIINITIIVTTASVIKGFRFHIRPPAQCNHAPSVIMHAALRITLRNSRTHQHSSCCMGLPKLQKIRPVPKAGDG